jgi:ABC-2 type transport system permease protein
MNKRNSSWRRLRALIWKEGIQIVHDPSSILIAFVLPVLLLFLFGFAVSLDSTNLRIGFVMEDRSPETESLLAAFRGSKYFQLYISYSRKELERELLTGKIRGIVVVPIDFSRKREWSNTERPIQIIADGSEPTIANFVQNYASALITLWMQQRGLETGVPVPASINI